MADFYEYMCPKCGWFPIIQVLPEVPAERVEEIMKAKIELHNKEECKEQVVENCQMNNKTWEKEFDTKFHERGGWYEENCPFDCWEAFDGLRTGIKSFISQALDTQRKELDSKWFLAIAHLPKELRDSVLETHSGITQLVQNKMTPQESNSLTCKESAKAGEILSKNLTPEYQPLVLIESRHWYQSEFARSAGFYCTDEELAEAVSRPDNFIKSVYGVNLYLPNFIKQTQ